ncbi:hypothetical protein BGX23_005555 [Mortierella sp. AD031]|nr:hypothetical protein BGX23_005555 [Mortierella sp. AD031]
MSVPIKINFALPPTKSTVASVSAPKAPTASKSKTNSLKIRVPPRPTTKIPSTTKATPSLAQHKALSFTPAQHKAPLVAPAQHQAPSSFYVQHKTPSSFSTQHKVTSSSPAKTMASSVILAQYTAPPVAPVQLKASSVPFPVQTVFFPFFTAPSPAIKQDEDEEMEDMTFFDYPLDKDGDFLMMDASEPMCMADAPEPMDVDDD